MRIPKKLGVLSTITSFLASSIFGCASTELQVNLPEKVNPKPYYLTDEEGNRAPRFLDDYALITLDLNGDGDWDKIVWGFDQNNDRKVNEKELYDVRFGSALKGVYPVNLPKDQEKELEYPQGTLPSSSTSATPAIEIPTKNKREKVLRLIGSIESLEARLPEVIFSTGDSTLDVILSRRFHSFAQRLFMAAFDYNKEGQDKIAIYVAIAGRGVYPVVFNDVKMEFKVGEPLSIERMQEVEREREIRYIQSPDSTEKPEEVTPKTSEGSQESPNNQ